MSTTLMTTWMQQHYNDINFATARAVGVLAFTRTPEFDLEGIVNVETLAEFATYDALSDITSKVEWVPTTSTVTPTHSLFVRSYSGGGITGLQLVDSGGVAASVDAATPKGWEFLDPGTPVQEVVTAVVFYLTGTYLSVVNPILFATTQGIGVDTVVHDEAMYGQFESFPVTHGNVRIVTVDTAAIPIEFEAAHLLLKPALPAWESSHAQHLWLEPQRTNLIVNPSFEVTGHPGWCSELANFSRVSGGVGGLDRPYCGLFTPTVVNANVVVETNNFPVPSDWFSVSAYISVAALDVSADLTFGLVGFDPSYTTATYYCSDTYLEARIIAVGRAAAFANFTTDAPHGYFVGDVVEIDTAAPWNGTFVITDVGSDVRFSVANAGANVAEAPEVGVATATKKLQASGGTATENFVQYQAVVKAPVETTEMCFRLESKGCTNVWIDNVLVDPHEGQFAYFDGNSTESFPEDFRWMGGLENAHFSCWYNNYLNTHRRLFSDWDEDEGRYKSGLVEEWAPTGSTIIDHWDAVTSFTPLNWAGNAFYPVNEVSGTPVTVIDERVSFKE